jgi:anti-sigma B factor antagonist
MQIDVVQEGGVHVARLHDVLDESAHDVFENQLHPLITERGRRLVLDLSGVPRATSSGLGLLVTLVARANTKGANVVLAAPSPFVASVLGVTRLDQFFTMAESVESAVRA